MKLKKLVRFLLKNKMDFSVQWDCYGKEYYISVILGNIEFVATDKDRVKTRVIYMACREWLEDMR